ncbi:hypothetical protein ACQKGD_19575 [Peribacillus frigoritolerans]|uniref:hypothetical protein n=1 Tax=Peribacillus TaxID=2675229 RepID=UPI0007D816FC
MKKLILSSLIVVLTGCQSEAQEDYERCNDEFADGVECTEEEFKDFLYYEYENNAQIFGGTDEATAETTNKAINEIEEKIDEIFK